MSEPVEGSVHSCRFIFRVAKRLIKSPRDKWADRAADEALDKINQLSV